MMTLYQLVKEGAAVLADAGVAEAEPDARRLLLAAFQINEAHYLLDRMRPFAGTSDEMPAVTTGRRSAGTSDEMPAMTSGRRSAGTPDEMPTVTSGRRSAGTPDEMPAVTSGIRSAGMSGINSAGAETQVTGYGYFADGGWVRDAQRRIDSYCRMISLRAKRVPLQYILREQEFMGLPFRVGPEVLIPRQDTETLAELVLYEQTDREKSVLDLCTGSGCIAVSLAVRGGYREVTATDLSAEALQTAEKNACALLGSGWDIVNAAGLNRPEELPEQESLPSHRFLILQGDLFGALPAGSRYDILVSNPPYIPGGVIGGLQPEVRDYEPRMALDGAADGLAFYRRIAAEAPGWLRRGASVYLEIGCDQAEAVSGLLAAHGFTDIEVFKDLPGLDRVVRGRYDHV